MCGIVGVFCKTGVVDQSGLEAAVKALYHRGPDTQRMWISDDGQIGLGHSRLRIIDLKTGDQPLESADGQIHAIVNGEFYEFEKIRAGLMEEGYRFKTSSDSEILIALYQKHGPDCVHHLRGEFAFILWDDRLQRLFVGRDRFGIKPIFYYQDENRIVFASESKALFKYGVPAVWNPRQILFSSTMVYPLDGSLFEGIKAIKPGHYHLITRETFHTESYWQPEYLKTDDIPKDVSEQEIIASLRERLEEAVRIRMRADVPVGTYLSGGLDSTVIMGLMSKHHPKPRAFSISFAEAEYDEAPYAHEVAEFFHADYTEIKCTQRDLAEHFYDTIVNCEQFIPNAGGVGKFLLSKSTHDGGYRVVLTGEGADDTLGGYDDVRLDMFLYDNDHQDQQLIRRELSARSQNSQTKGILEQAGRKSFEYMKQKLGYVPCYMMKFNAVTSDILIDLCAPDYREQFSACNISREMIDALDFRYIDGRSPVIKSLFTVDIKNRLPGYLLTVLGDRAEMSHSVEARLPFMDHRLFEVTRSIPAHLMIKGITEKYILKEAVKDLIPESIYKAPRKHSCDKRQ